MATHSMAKSTNSSPLQSATAAVSSTGVALKDAAGEMAAKVSGALPAAGRLLSKAVYTTCYCASYGVTFPTVLLLHVIPGGIPIATGFADGARSARDYVRGMQDRSAVNRRILAESPDEALTGTDDATENASSKAAPAEKRKVGAAKKASKAPLRKPAAPSAKKSSKGSSKPKKAGK